MLTFRGGICRRVEVVLDFLHAAGPELKKIFLEQAEYTQFKTGEHLFYEGQSCEILAFVLSGRARAYKVGESGREITLFRVEAGDGCILGASCILNQTPYPAFAVAETDLEVVVIPAPVFKAWVDKYPFWRMFVFQLMSQRITSVITLIEEVAFRRMDVRIAEYLVAACNGKRCIRATHQQVAADLGTSREVVSRILKDFEHQGWIGLSRNSIQVKNISALEMSAK